MLTSNWSSGWPMLLTNGNFASSGRHWNNTSYWKKSTFSCCRRPTSIPATSISAMCHGTAISRWVAIVTAYLKPCVVSAIEFTAYYFYSLTVHWFDASIVIPWDSVWNTSFRLLFMDRTRMTIVLSLVW